MVDLSTSLQRLLQTVRELRKSKVEGMRSTGRYFEEFRELFCQAMDDDFSTPKAIAVLFDLSREANSLLTEKSPNPEAILDAENLFSTLGGDILGIIPEFLENEPVEMNLKDVMDILLELRTKFRKNKDFENADLIRERLEKIGIVFKDSPEGTTWEKNAKN